MKPVLDGRTGIAIFGKSQGNRPENPQLDARIAAAAALWHASSGDARPKILYVARDIGGAERTPHADVVRRGLLRLGVAEASILTRRNSNCTFVEVRALRDLCAEEGLRRIVGVTHAYHAARTLRYLREVMPAETACVTPVGPDLLEEGARLPESDAVATLIATSDPRGADLWRERAVEAAMNVLHAVDRGGTVERWLANAVRKPRGGAPKTDREAPGKG